MVLGIPNRLIVLGVLAAAFIIPTRTALAGGVVQSVSSSLASSFSALGSTRIEPVFNPTIGLGGNIGERIVSRAFGGQSDIVVDDPTGDVDVIGDIPGGGGGVAPEEIETIWEKIHALIQEEYPTGG
jgi:hypothetical protein